MDLFDSLMGHYGLQTASEVRSDLRFEISDLNYLHIHVHITYMFWTHFEGLLVVAEKRIELRNENEHSTVSDIFIF